MAVIISSPNPQSGKAPNPVPSNDPGYVHPAERRLATGIPLMFQITSPFDRRTVLLPHALVMHVNPSNFSENNVQKKETIPTLGGFVEQHWGHELIDISASGSTGAFMNVKTGLSSVVRQRTIAWDRYRDLVELYYNNGSVHDPYGNVVLQGHVMLMYDRGIFLGTFRSFETTETDDSPFAFQTSWTFKVDYPILQVPSGLRGIGTTPTFQQPQVTGLSTSRSPSQRNDINYNSTDPVIRDRAEAEAGYNRDLRQRAYRAAERQFAEESSNLTPERAALLSSISDRVDSIDSEKSAEYDAGND